MNDRPRQPTIELLIDGELSASEEIELLKSFGDDCARWRALAEVFLEDRILRAGLASPNLQVREPAMPATGEPSRARRLRSKTRVMLSVGSALMLLTTSFVAGRYSANGDVPPPSNSLASNTGASSKGPDPESPGIELEPERTPPIEFVSLNVATGNETAARIDLPLLPWERVSTVAQTPPTLPPEKLIPDDIRAILAEHNSDIRERMTYIPFEMADGRRGVIPVSNVEIRSTALPAIQ